MQDEHLIEAPGGDPPPVPQPIPEDIPAFVEAEVPPDQFAGEQRHIETPPPPRGPSFSEIARRGLLAMFVALAGWAVPGAGHLILRRWGRAVIGFVAVAILAFAGLKMRGNVFPYHGTDPFDALGFIADAGSGVFYLLSKTVQAAGPDVSHAAGDYGTRMIAAAGILNFLLLIDASEIASGQKS
jgi:hypothetical protein